MKIRCFWCDLLVKAEDAFLDRATGKIKCRECVEYDASRSHK